MTADQWILIAGLAATAFAIRLGGVLGGAAISRSVRLSRWLADMPGGILMGLVGASLAFGGVAEWLAAALALWIARWGGIVGAMVAGMAAVVALGALGL